MDSAVEAPLYLGCTLDDRYRIDSFLNGGGFGLVFEAFDVLTEQTIAVKILSMNSRMDDQVEFETEAQLLERLRSCSNVVSMLDTGRGTIDIKGPTDVAATVEVPYIALELADGCLEQLLLRREELPWHEKLELYRGVVRGIHQMHLGHVVHRDIKSGNVLLFVSEGGVTAKVTDLGRSRHMDSPPHFASQDYAIGRGDLRFAPPELIWGLGRDDPFLWIQCELYLLGSLLFELATGQGITAVSMGDPRPIMAATMNLPDTQRARQFQSRVAETRSRYEIAYRMFEDELPATIRHPCSQLLRQLTNADPQRRLPRRLAPKRAPSHWDLQWLLRRIDILCLLMTRADADRTRLDERRRRRQTSGVEVREKGSSQ